MDDFNTSSGVVSPASLMTSIPSMSPEIDVKPHLKMEDFTKPHTADLLVRKPVKKRKSWGQQLPDPKTNLAPRKRAKTDDEKEQRRIERIKRNRAAAHNSRERKRVEAEHLANANDILVQRIQTLQRRLAEQDAQLEKCKELLPEGLPHVPEEEIAYDKDYFPDPESVSPVSSSFTFDPRASIDTSDSPTSPKVTVKLEEHDSPIIFSQVDSLSSGGPQGSGSLDPTQHSAAMLCDLQCRSSLPSPQSTSPPSNSRNTTSTPTSSFQFLLMLLTTHSLFTEVYKTCLLAIWTVFPTIKFPSTSQASVTLPTSSTLTPLRLLLTLFQRQQQPTPQLHQLQQLRQLSALWTRLQPTWSTLAQQILRATGPSSSVISAHLLALNDPVQKPNVSRLLTRDQVRLACRSRLESDRADDGDRVGGPKGPDKECLE